MIHDLHEGVAAFQTDLLQIREDGAAALRRLLVRAQSGEAQSLTIGRRDFSMLDRPNNRQNLVPFNDVELRQGHDAITVETRLETEIAASQRPDGTKARRLQWHLDQ